MTKIIIAGAGPAGLTAAYELLKRGCSVTVMEAGNSVGGAARTLKMNGGSFDIGGHFFKPEDKRVLSILNEILPFAGDSEKADNVMLKRSLIKRIYYRKKFFEYDPDFSVKEHNIKEEKGFAAFILGIIKKLTGKREIESVGSTEEFLYPKLGPGQLCETLAKKIEEMGGEIITNCRVKRLVKTGDRITALQYLENGKARVIECDMVISSIPLDELVNSINGVPKDISDLVSSLLYQNVLSVGVLLSEMAPENRTQIKTAGNIVPDGRIYIKDEGVALREIIVYNNISPYLLKEPESTVLLGLKYFCKDDDALWKMNEQELKELAVGELLKIGIIDGRDDVIDIAVYKAQKAFPAGGEGAKGVKAYLETIENLILIGANGYHLPMETGPAMITALKAADMISDNKKRC